MDQDREARISNINARQIEIAEENERQFREAQAIATSREAAQRRLADAQRVLLADMPELVAGLKREMPGVSLRWEPDKRTVHVSVNNRARPLPIAIQFDAAKLAFTGSLLGADVLTLPPIDILDVAEVKAEIENRLIAAIECLQARAT